LSLAGSAATCKPRPVETLPHDRGGRFQSNADRAALIDKGTLGGNALTTSSGVNIGAIEPPL
jgi:hypothetical protein